MHHLLLDFYQLVYCKDKSNKFKQLRVLVVRTLSPEFFIKIFLFFPFFTSDCEDVVLVLPCHKYDDGASHGVSHSS